MSQNHFYLFKAHKEPKSGDRGTITLPSEDYILNKNAINIYLIMFFQKYKKTLLTPNLSKVVYIRFACIMN